MYNFNELLNIYFYLSSFQHFFLSQNLQKYKTDERYFFYQKIRKNKKKLVLEKEKLGNGLKKAKEWILGYKLFQTRLRPN